MTFYRFNYKIVYINDYTIKINGKLIVQPVYRNGCVSDIPLSQKEFDVVSQYLKDNFNQKLEVWTHQQF